MGTPMKWRFALKFLLAFTVLLTLWSWSNFAHFYRNAVLTTVQRVSPTVNGWSLEFDRPNPVGDIVFHSGNRELAMLLELPVLSMGLVPLLSLIVATPGLRMRQTGLRGLAGALLYFLIDVIVVLAYPLIMDQPNVFKDTMGVFTGLIAFVVAPLGLWFILTYSVLRPLWQLTFKPPR
jgi:hypothetical protein